MILKPKFKISRFQEWFSFAESGKFVTIYQSGKIDIEEDDPSTGYHAYQSSIRLQERGDEETLKDFAARAYDQYRKLLLLKD